MVCAPVTFYERVFWPEFAELAGALGAGFDRLTTRVLRDVLDDATLEIGPRDPDEGAAG